MEKSTASSPTDPYAGAILLLADSESHIPGQPAGMEQVDLERYEITGLLGTGADYEVRAAVDRGSFELA